MSASLTLERLHRLLSQSWSMETKAGDGLSFNEYCYLRVIGELAGAGVCKDDSATGHDGHGPHLTDLAKALGVKRASVSTMLAKLEKQQLIVRLDCQHDARAQHIMVTPDGHKALEAGRAIYDRLANGLFGDLKVSDLEKVGAATDAALKSLSD